MLNELEKWVIEELKDKFEELEGQEVYLADLPQLLLENEVNCGSYSCSAKESEQWIKLYFSEIRQFVKSLDDDVKVSSVFEVEAFQLDIICLLTKNLLWRSKFVSDNYELMTLDAEAIKCILDELNKY